METEFAQAAQDYATHRTGYPDKLFQHLKQMNIGKPGQKVLDMVTGSGNLARGFAERGCHVTAIDDKQHVLAQADSLTKKANLQIDFQLAKTDKTCLSNHSYDVVSAGRCWQQVNQATTLNEIKRVIMPRGHLVITDFNWLPYQGEVTQLTEHLMLRFNPAWTGADNNGFQLSWLDEMHNQGFENIETFSFDRTIAFSQAAWRGNVLSHHAVVGQLSALQTKSLDAELTLMLRNVFTDTTLNIPHRIFAIVARPPHFGEAKDIPKKLIIRQLAVYEKPPWDLLLLADPSRSQVNQYLSKGHCYIAMLNDEIVGEYVLLQKTHTRFEIMNLAVTPKFQRQGIGLQLIKRALTEAKQRGATLVDIGTGNSSIAELKLYQRVGFNITHIEKGYFTAQYPRTIIENGITRKDKICLSINV